MGGRCCGMGILDPDALWGGGTWASDQWSSADACLNKNNSGALDCIKAHINASVDGAGNKQKHRDALSASDLFSLSVSFFGHDQRVTDKLPPRVCSPDARKLPMSNFHSR